VASKGSKVLAMIDECEYTPLSQDQKLAASLLVCANAVDAADAHDLMGMLGLLPGQEDEEYIVGPAPAMNRDCL
jgi:hypothetical protein